ncbi:hypothetical protein GCM10023187_34780 [Nibrella viscosa]|uniref:Putative restriction endonuclease domain-containing protein n=2 Tax=Nibrella viscosa TaxID=1084524 RepID=A0ABP8KLS0_9BACT
MTWAERAAGPVMLRVPATWEEYLDLVDEVPYTIEYVNGEIISSAEAEKEGNTAQTGQASFIHELLVVTLAKLLANYFDDLGNYSVVGSNIKIYAEACRSEFNADVPVIQGVPDFVRLPSSKLSGTQLTNSYLVVEILSESTKDYDLGTKLSVL